MKQNPPSMFFVKIDGAAVSEHDGSLSSAENKLVTQRRGHEFERESPLLSRWVRLLGRLTFKGHF